MTAEYRACLAARLPASHQTQRTRRTLRASQSQPRVGVVQSLVSWSSLVSRSIVSSFLIQFDLIPSSTRIENLPKLTELDQLLARLHSPICTASNPHAASKARKGEGRSNTRRSWNGKPSPVVAISKLRGFRSQDRPGRGPRGTLDGPWHHDLTRPTTRLPPGRAARPFRQSAFPAMAPAASRKSNTSSTF